MNAFDVNCSHRYTLLHVSMTSLACCLASAVFSAVIDVSLTTEVEKYIVYKITYMQKPIFI